MKSVKKKNIDIGRKQRWVQILLVSYCTYEHATQCWQLEKAWKIKKNIITTSKMKKKKKKLFQKLPIAGYPK